MDNDKTIEAQWVIDSETGDKVLVCQETGEELWRRSYDE